MGADDRAARVDRICLEALSKDGPEREAFLAAACRDDAPLRREIESLLANQADASDFLETPAWSPPAPLAPGVRLGEFELVSLLGEGGMGQVYRARDTRLDRMVALKVLSPRLAADPQRRLRFEREARAIARLRHPHICTLYDVGRTDGLAFMVMEALEGETLAARLARGPLTLDDAVHRALEIAEALATAHREGVVHRDLKPANVMLTGEGAKLLDFGLAKLHGNAEHLEAVAGTTFEHDATIEGTIVGTLHYMAPEQVEGRTSDARTDVWAFGALLYEMVTARRAFDGAGAASVIASIIRGEAPRITDLSAAVDVVVQKCLAKNPAQRYQSTDEIVRALRSFSASGNQEARGHDEPVSASVPLDGGGVALDARAPGALRASSPTRVSSLGIAATVLTLAAAAGIVGVANRQPLKLTGHDRLVVADFDNGTGDPLLGPAVTLAFSVGLQQSRYANLVSPSRVRAVMTRMARPVDATLTEDAAREVCEREGARGVIAGAIAKVGHQYVISVRIVDPRTDTTLAAHLERAKDEGDVLAAVGRVATHVRRELGESHEAIRESDRPLPQVTTPSLPALRAFAQAGQAWSAGQYRRAVDLWRTALAHDPDFAMAHAALGGALLSHVFSERDMGRRHYETAMQLSARTTERERLRVVAGYHAALGHTAQAQVAFRVYLDTYPDDVDVRASYAHSLMLSGRPGDALREYETVARTLPADANVLINLATCARSLGRPADALDYYQRAFTIEPRWLRVRNLNHEYGFTLVAAGDRAKAREVFTTQSTDAENALLGLRSLALLSAYEGKSTEAKRLLEQSVAVAVQKGPEMALARARNLWFLAREFHAEGNVRGTSASLDRAVVALHEWTSPAPVYQARIGGLYARIGSCTKARTMWAKATAEVDRENPEDLRELRLLEGEMALACVDRGRALALVTRTGEAVADPPTLALIARTSDAAGDVRPAIAAYESLVATWRASLGWEPQWEVVDARVRAAELYVTAGDRVSAARILAPVIELWTEADPALPLAHRISRLRTSLDATPMAR